MNDSWLLEVSDLRVQFRSPTGPVEVLHGVSLQVRAGCMHGIIGETGSGKSMITRAVMGMLPQGGEVTSGSARFESRELLGLSQAQLRRVRGAEVGMVFQNPRTALYPMKTVGKQMAVVCRSHLQLSRREVDDRIRHYLSLAGIPDPERVAGVYPHELSGGLAQRVVIATSLLCEPRLLIADEPTTGLDVTVQLQVLRLLDDLRERLGLGILLITHDLGIVTQFCDQVSVLRNGAVVESGDKRDVLGDPRDEYTRALIAASRLRDRDSAPPESSTRAPVV